MLQDTILHLHYVVKTIQGICCLVCPDTRGLPVTDTPLTTGKPFLFIIGCLKQMNIMLLDLAFSSRPKPL